MQTILGANGQIATELARELHRSYTTDIRLVSRNPRSVNASDALVSADLLDASQTLDAVSGSDVVYFTAGLPADTNMWVERFPTMLRNALAASRDAGAAFAYFDNTYMYPQTAALQTEETEFAPHGAKGRIRAEMARMVIAEMDRGDIPVLIARAPEFYGPGRTQSFTNRLVFDRLAAGKRAIVPVRDDRLRTLIWTPDASRGLAVLGNEADAFGQTWHLPVDAERMTYRGFAMAASEAFGRRRRPLVMPEWALRTAGRFSGEARELAELLPRYRHDNLFDSSAFTARFPDFRVATYREGIDIIRDERGSHH